MVDANSYGIIDKGLANVPIINNTIVVTGTRHLDDTYGRLFIVKNDADHDDKAATGCSVINNIVSAANATLVAVDADSEADTVINHNLLYRGAGANAYMIKGATTYSTWAALVAAGLADASYSSDPLFLSATDFHIKSGSPAAKAGIFVPGVHDQPGCKDLDGIDCNSMHINIGAYPPARPDGTPIYYPTLEGM